MTVVLVALVNRHGEVLLRMRDEQSPVRANRWSLIGGGTRPGETPKQAAARLIEEQTGLGRLGHDLSLAWRGNLPDPPLETFLYAARTPATDKDITTDAIPGAMARRGEYVVRFVPGEEVQSGRAFTPASGFVIGQFLDSRRYHELFEDLDIGEIA